MAFQKLGLVLRLLPAKCFYLQLLTQNNFLQSKYWLVNLKFSFIIAAYELFVLTPKATLCKRRQKERKSQRGWMTPKSHLNTVGQMHIGTHIAVCTGLHRPGIDRVAELREKADTTLCLQLATAAKEKLVFCNELLLCVLTALRQAPYPAVERKYKQPH